MAEQIKFKGRTYYVAKVVPYSPTGKPRPTRAIIYMKGAPKGKATIGNIEYTENKKDLVWRVHRKIIQKQPIIRQRIKPAPRARPEVVKGLWRFSVISNIDQTRDDRGKSLGLQYRVWAWFDRKPERSEINAVRLAYRQLEQDYPPNSPGVVVPEPSEEGPTLIDSDEMVQPSLGVNTWERAGEYRGKWMMQKMLPSPEVNKIYGYVYFRVGK